MDMRWSRALPVFFLVWFSMIGVDFFLHAGILTFLYIEPHPFLIPPERAFALIPIGYLSFGIQAGFLVWLAIQLKPETAISGLWLGFGIGSVIWGSLILGLYSIANAPVALLLGWFAGQTIEMAVGGMVAVLGLNAEKLRPLVIGVFLQVVVLVILTIILQSTGLVPAITIN